MHGHAHLHWAQPVSYTHLDVYKRQLYARAGTPYCHDHGVPLQSQTVSQMVDAVLVLPVDTRLMLLAPVAREKKGEFTELFAQMQALGYICLLYTSRCV